MAPLLIFLLSLYQLQLFTQSEIVDASKLNLNPLKPLHDEDMAGLLIPPEVNSVENEINMNSMEVTEDDDEDDGNGGDRDNRRPNGLGQFPPLIRSGQELTEMNFQYPITSVNIDYAKNMIILKFKKELSKQRLKLNNPEEEAKRKSLEKNFMRFGRSPADFMRLGKRQSEQLPSVNTIDHHYYQKQPGDRFERSYEGAMRDSRGDNFMRFGRSHKDFMRFGRASGDFMRFGRGSVDFMRLGRSPADFMRLGRAPADDFMRFGRNMKQNFMRLGRTTKAQKNFMRFGRPDNFMRFGRTPPDPADSSANFMRFGKSIEDTTSSGESNQTKPLFQKSDIKETAKLLHQSSLNKADPNESNPVDRAIKVLYNNQREQMQRPNNDATTLRNDEFDMTTDYDFN